MILLLIQFATADISHVRKAEILSKHNLYTIWVDFGGGCVQYATQPRKP